MDRKTVLGLSTDGPFRCRLGRLTGLWTSVVELTGHFSTDRPLRERHPSVPNLKFLQERTKCYKCRRGPHCLIKTTGTSLNGPSRRYRRHQILGVPLVLNTLSGVCRDDRALTAAETKIPQKLRSRSETRRWYPTPVPYPTGPRFK